MIQLGKDWEAGEIDNLAVMRHIVRFTNIHSLSSGEPDALFQPSQTPGTYVKTLVQLKYKSLKKNRLSQVFDM